MKRIVLISLLLWEAAAANSPGPYPRPKLEMPKAIQVATEYARKSIHLENYYMDRVWLGKENAASGEKWIVSFSPDPASGTKGWYIVVVDMEGRVSKPVNGVRWIN